ncbi:TPA: hypothetical protein EYP37_00260 [Candidatus Poribacteria bacterium]|nr:hypothetical protein [Candidatus Poribacteria bacterium]
MLFMSLLIYLILWFPYYKLSKEILPFSFISVWFSSFFLFGISFLFSLFILYIVHSFGPEKKPFLRNLLRLRGIRWIAFSTATMAVISFVLITAFKGINPGIFGALIPIGGISFLNLLGIEIFPRMLREEETTPRVVRPPREPETPEIPEDILKEFKWRHEGQQYSLRLVIRNSLYEEFKSKERIFNPNEWAKEYVAGGICGEIRELAHGLLRIGKPYGTYEEVNFVLSFVQQIVRYESEEKEYPKYPVETLVEEAGDCEDFSILGAAILKVMGYDVALLILPRHVALGVGGAEGIPGAYVEHNGRRYYYCEMTSDGWRIGDIPEKFKDAKIDVHPIPGITVNITDKEG